MRRLVLTFVTALAPLSAHAQCAGPTATQTFTGFDARGGAYTLTAHTATCAGAGGFPAYFEMRAQQITYTVPAPTYLWFWQPPNLFTGAPYFFYEGFEERRLPIGGAAGGAVSGTGVTFGALAETQSLTTPTVTLAVFFTAPDSPGSIGAPGNPGGFGGPPATLVTLTATPEPGTLALLATGLLVTTGLARRRRVHAVTSSRAR